MGKSGRHKRLNRQEKAKTGLKGTKRLDKAQNVVTPSLRVKRIVIREQLEEGEEDKGPTTRRKQTLVELLSSLHHHNTHLRKEAVGGLTELVSGHEGILKGNLDKILERVASLTADLEGAVRKENLKLATIIFQKITESEVGPFWPLLLTHLQCSLTHLNPAIRYGTLPIFHLLLQHFPSIVASDLETVLSSLLDLISNSSSSKNNKTQLKIEVAGTGRIENRIQVFKLIDESLQLKTWKDQKKSSLVSSSSIQSEGLVYPFGYEEYSSSHSLSLTQMVSHSIDLRQQESDSFWPTFASSCISSLIQTWIELIPGSDNDSLEILGNVLLRLLNKVEQEEEEGIKGSQNVSHASSCCHYCWDLIRTSQGFELKKHLFSKLPLHSNSGSLITLNLQLFLVSSKVGLMDNELRGRMERFILDVMRMDGSILEWSQVDLTLQLLRRESHSNQSQSCLSTDFILWILSCKTHRREMCKFLQKELGPGSDSGSAMDLDWDNVTSKLMNTFSHISAKWLNLMTHIALRQLSDIKGELLRKMKWFQGQLGPSSPLGLWNECLRLFWYANALPEFKKAFGESYPETVKDVISSLDHRSCDDNE